MKKRFLPCLMILASTLQSCIVVGGVFRAGFKMGVYSIFLIVGLLIWIISKRSNRK